MKKLIMVAIAVNTAVAGLSLAATKGPDGAELLEKRCGACHSVGKVKGKKQTAAEWDAIVTRMMNRGAELSDVEKKVLVDHLAKKYRP